MNAAARRSVATALGDALDGGGRLVDVTLPREDARALQLLLDPPQKPRVGVGRKQGEGRPAPTRTLRPRSARRSREEREYARLRAEFLEEHPYCEWCGLYASEVHHRAGRSGRRLNDTARWAALCRSCHERTTVQPEWAMQVGLSTSRLAKEGA